MLIQIIKAYQPPDSPHPLPKYTRLDLPTEVGNVLIDLGVAERLDLPRKRNKEKAVR